MSLAPRVAVVGGGPAGLMAADVLSASGVAVAVYDAKPSVGRKFLLAGKGGLNLTHAEPLDVFIGRYGAAAQTLAPLLRAFGPAQMRSWAESLGVATFVGSSQRIFPTDLKAAPLLRAWLHRLRQRGVAFHMRHRWIGWQEDRLLVFETPHGIAHVAVDATILALGGASWPQLGSDGAWVPRLVHAGLAVSPLRPSNCGFDVGVGAGHGPASGGWSDHFRGRHAGAALKNSGLSFASAESAPPLVGECVVTETGLEGSLVYALSARCRDRIDADGVAAMRIDLLPQRSAEHVLAEVRRPRGSRSLATHLASRLGIDGVKAALLHELAPKGDLHDPARLAGHLKALPLAFVRPRPLAEAISTAGGVCFAPGDDPLRMPGPNALWCAGEMLDWEAPTGGHLLTACCATGHAAGRAVARRLRTDRA